MGILAWRRMDDEETGLHPPSDPVPAAIATSPEGLYRATWLYPQAAQSRILPALELDIVISPPAGFPWSLISPDPPSHFVL